MIQIFTLGSDLQSRAGRRRSPLETSHDAFLEGNQAVAAAGAHHK